MSKAERIVFLHKPRSNVRRDSAFPAPGAASMPNARSPRSRAAYQGYEACA